MVALLVLLAVGAGPASAAPALVSLGPDGGTISALARSSADPRVVYAAGGGTWFQHGAPGVWRSTDDGHSWTPYGGRPPRLGVQRLLVGPGPGAPVTALSFGTLYRSVSGSQWTPDLAAGPFDVVAAAGSQASRWYGIRIVQAGSTCIFRSRRSTDAGSTWADAGTVTTAPCSSAFALQPHDLVVDPSDPLRAVALVDGGPQAWQTDDGAATWHRLSDPPAATTALLIPPPATHVVATTPTGPVSLPFGGVIWSPGLPCAGLVPEVFLPFTFPPGCSGTAAPDGQIQVLAATAPAAGVDVLAGSFGIGVARFSGTWTAARTGLTALHADGGVQLADGSFVLATERGMLHRTTAGVWESWYDGVSIVLSDQRPAVTADGAALAPGIAGLYRRGPLDAAWSPIALPGDAQPTSVRRAPGPTAPIYVTTADHILASDDGGATWPHHIKMAVVALAPSASDPRIAYAMTPAGALVATGDRGATWHLVSNRGYGGPLGVDPADPLHVVMSARSAAGLAVSRDGGRTWRRASHLATDAWGYDAIVTDFAFDPTTPGAIYATSATGGILATADDGITWARIGPNGPFVGASAFVSGSAVPTTAPRFAATSGMAGGLVRIDERVHLPKLVGRVRHDGRRTGTIATCRGGRATGLTTTVRWLANLRPIGTGRRFRIPGERVGQRVLCEVQVVYPYARVTQRSTVIVPVGRPWPMFVRVRGNRRTGGLLTCTSLWRGGTRSVTYRWRVRGAIRGTGSHYRLTEADRGRPVTCEVTARNRYGARTGRGSTDARA